MEQNPFTSTAANEFADNPEPRCASLLILDVSSSMSGDRIRELQEGLTVYKDELAGDGLARKRVEVAIVTFGGSVDTIQNFTTVDNFTPPTLAVNGDTPMGQAVVAGLNLLDQRKQEYRNNGIGYYRPWVFLITDGGPTDINTPQWPEAIQKVKAGEEAKSFAFFGVGVEDADMDRLAQVCVREPMKLKGLQFRTLFQWLSNSQQSVSRSTPGDAVPLENPKSPEGWAQI
jgi:uncharacterized protein YegL